MCLWLLSIVRMFVDQRMHVARHQPKGIGNQAGLWSCACTALYYICLFLHFINVSFSIVYFLYLTIMEPVYK